jgi:translation initiation factor 2 beta subunit (eIF-2beta)/eIF-5
MGIEIILAEGAGPPALAHDGSYDEKRHAVLLPRGACVIGVGGFLFDEVSSDGKMTEAANRFWLRFVDIKYIKTIDGVALFRNFDLCPVCDVMDHVFRNDGKRGVVRSCRRCGRELPTRE